MASSGVFALAACFCLALYLSMVMAYPQAPQAAQAAGNHSHGNKSMGIFSQGCAGEQFKMQNHSDAESKEFQTCWDKSSKDPKDEEAKCQSHVCMGQKMGLIDAKGALDKAKITAKIDAMAPTSKKADIVKAVNTCIGTHEKALDLTKCNTYTALITCVKTSMKTVCDWKDMPAPGAAGGAPGAATLAPASG